MRKKYIRVGFTPAQSSELWDRWRKGEGLKSIGRALGKPSSCMFNHLRRSGGIRPAGRTRSSLALTLAERDEIARGIAVGQSLRSIAGSLGRSPSTVSREIRRNGGPVRYRAAGADKRAWAVARRPKACKLATDPRLCRTVARKLERNWSPEQIAGWLKRSYSPHRLGQTKAAA
jgi:IS30 family transposase